MRKLLIAMVLVVPAVARAEHEHGMHSEPDAHAKVSVGAMAASYRSHLFEGEYQGAVVRASYVSRSFEIGASNALYRIVRNGKPDRGLGDLTVFGNANLFARGSSTGGAHVMAMLPTGDAMLGLGMGHVMLMPALWYAWTPDAGSLSVALGYSQAIGGGHVHAAHGGGGWPLVDPMTASEMIYDVTGLVRLDTGLHVGARSFGADV